jgi:hypothetical protein
MAIKTLFAPGAAAAWTALFTGILAVFTVVLVYYTALLYNVSRDANDSTQRIERATVFMGGLGGVRKLLSDDNTRWDRVRVGFFFRNGGPTAPRNLRAKLSYQVFDGEMPSDFAFSDNTTTPPRTLFLGPDTQQATFIDLPLSAIEDVVERKKQLFVWGWATYNDVFNGTPPRLMEFCSELIDLQYTHPVPETPLDNKNRLQISLETCPRHNCYDADCADYETRVARRLD